MLIPLKIKLPESASSKERSSRVLPSSEGRVPFSNAMNNLKVLQLAKQCRADDSTPCVPVGHVP